MHRIPILVPATNHYQEVIKSLPPSIAGHFDGHKTRFFSYIKIEHALFVGPVNIRNAFDYISMISVLTIPSDQTMICS